MLLLLTDAALAHSTGITGYSTSGCTSCHATAPNPAVTGDLTATTTTVAPADSLPITFTVTSTNASHQIGGLDVSASGGTLVPAAGTYSVSGEITRTTDQHFSGGRALWTFSWVAPATEGVYTLSSSGLAGDHSHSEFGDGWDLDTLVITVDDGCEDVDGDGWEGCDDGSGDDCDDGDVLISPDGAETCNSRDDDCNGIVDDDPVDGTEMWPDGDGDGFGDVGGASRRTCAGSPGPGMVFDGTDCDDSDAAIHTGATELCDGDDNDCDGMVDGASAADAQRFYADADGDGYGDAASSTLDCALPAAFAVNPDDCDDTRAGVSPAGVEVCDALDLDEDCDGGADDADSAPTGTTTWYVDADADGYGGAATLDACVLPAGYATYAGDCDDADTRFNPAASESCDDPTDYNCDGSSAYQDNDGDGAAACLDCNDADAGAHLGATELCNAVDDNCDGTVDEATAADAPVWFVDADADGWGSVAQAVVSCTQPAGFCANAEDCDDAAAGTRPDAPESWYDGVDQDCDGADDDQDADGFALADDCDDLDATIHPGAADTPYDDVDADCANDSDNDADADGHDSASHGGDDCDDAAVGTWPGAPDEPYDGVITDCDDADEYDLDGDGYDLADDCDDANSAIHPDAEEAWYDGIDDDCDGNDADRDGDGIAYTVDCDDQDPALLVDCDPTDDVPVDTDEPTADAKGCGCATGPDAGLALGGLVALVTLGRRRRVV